MNNLNSARKAAALILAIALAAPAAGQATVAGGRDSAARLPAALRVEHTPDAWWQDAVFYELFVRSFSDSSTGALANDGIGDFRGIIDRLDYLNDGDPETDTDLGITGIWLMPIMESPSYHGYDIVDYREIDREYGSNADFQAFVDACHERGIRVVIDLVLNHCSKDNSWFLESIKPDSPKRDWFVWKDSNPGFNGPWRQRVWHRSPARDGSYYYGLFWSGMPDLNFENEAVTKEFEEVTRFWIEDMNIDGFRLDAIRHLIEDGEKQDNTPATHAWLQRYYTFIKDIDPEIMTVGEVWAESEVVSQYVGDEMDLAFEFELASGIVDSVRDKSAGSFKKAWARVDRLYPTGMYATFLRNHDQDRVMSVLNLDDRGMRLAAMMQLTLPGVPFVYYGEEIGMLGTKPDPDIRTPMQWTGGPGVGFTTGAPWRAPNTDEGSRNVQSQTDDPDSLLSVYRKLIRLRSNSRALKRGEVVVLDTPQEDLLCYARVEGDDICVCVFNLGDRNADSMLINAAADSKLIAGPLMADDALVGSISAVSDGFALRIPALEARTGLILRNR